MEISKKIKEFRKSNNLTQKELGQILNVSDKTISSWEVGRNYPDLETIVAISDLFEISLDELLRGDKEMLEQITEDTQVRKVQSKKIRYMMLGLCVLVIFVLVLGYKSMYSQEVVKSSQIESIKMTDRGEILIQTNLPFYRSVEGTATSANPTDPDIMDVRIDSKIDLTMKNDESLEVHPYTFTNLKQVNVVNKYGETIKTIVIK
ncbi:helix-turn-helix transcriptional regulator [Vagococcus carniphilus]|uniref:helix-turn-helix domain-containing protein n=1 Tax=Vagococcus carniphilus TaxID=218144 RepID=UPI00288E0F01|nr:helix-turn-helix transcriptional regulator [Vagococcus carniphilus]MDT2848242.1 helix-turn-helix transcriptional regulator [Vagococcus carniphilus]